MNTRQALDSGSTVIVAGVALVMAASYFQKRDARPKPVTWESAETVSAWKEDNKGAIAVGPANAPIVITEFVDFQCPFCAQLAPTIDSIRSAFPNEVSIVFHHFPLSIHKYAVPAAIAAECARSQGRFWPMYHALFARQEAFGPNAWGSFALDAGVPDTAAFARCVSMPEDSFPRIEADQTMGNHEGVSATPTTWVNGRVIRANMKLVAKLVTDSTKSE